MDLIKKLRTQEKWFLRVATIVAPERIVSPEDTTRLSDTIDQEELAEASEVFRFSTFQNSERFGTWEMVNNLLVNHHIMVVQLCKQGFAGQKNAAGFCLDAAELADASAILLERTAAGEKDGEIQKIQTFWEKALKKLGGESHWAYYMVEDI